MKLDEMNQDWLKGPQRECTTCEPPAKDEPRFGDMWLAEDGHVMVQGHRGAMYYDEFDGNDSLGG